MELDINGARIFFTLPIDLPVLGQLKISETMIVSWIVMILITGLCIWLTHDLKEENISKRQAVAELLVEQANKFVIGNMGEKFRYMIPFVAALFATAASIRICRKPIRFRSSMCRSARTAMSIFS